MCDEVPLIAPPDAAFGDDPIYVANEMPADDVTAWAQSKPGYQTLWIDRDHGGWIVVAFNADGAARQAELAEAFPGVGVAVVEVGYDLADLEELQQRVMDEMPAGILGSSGISVRQGVVTIGTGVMKPERLAALSDLFGGEAVCVEGIPVEDAPHEGPQQNAGDGWRLLATEPVGDSYRTWIAPDGDSFAALWEMIGLETDRPAVDFRSHVVIWFGVAYSSSCPDIRLDAVVVDHERAIVHAEIVHVDAPMECTGDANPRAYVVAFERAKLPTGPFMIQIDANRPPPGAPEERTVVDIDLSIPGSTPPPGAVHGDANHLDHWILESGGIVEPGYPAPYRFWTHCGVGWLGEINGVTWRADMPSPADLPAAWEPAVDGDGWITVDILLETDPGPSLTATVNGHAITYRPTLEEPPACR